MIVSEFTQRRFVAAFEPERSAVASAPLRRWRLAALHGMFGTAAAICSGHWRASTHTLRARYKL